VWSGRGRRAATGDGTYVVRARIRTPGGRIDERRVALRRSGGRFKAARSFDRRASCGLLSSFKLERPVFGGRSNRALSIAFRLSSPARVRVEVLRNGRVVRRFAESGRRAGITHRLRLASERLRRGNYVVRLTATAPAGGRVVARLTSLRL
jgi:hypothetical protein